ncbi:MAG: thioredoxin domain-containing protein [bacterium]|nr:thioredoxin domain-containing protein [bacterium]
MQKVKFTIQGMNCHSCAKLIEGQLKNQPGVISPKVDFDTAKAVVAFDEQKTTKDEIFKTIETGGEYKTEEIKESGEESEPADAVTQARPGAKKSSGSFLLGLMAGVSIISVSFNVLFSSALYNARAYENNLSDAGRIVQNVQPLPNPSALPGALNAPSPDAPVIQTFEVGKNDHVRGDFNAPITLVEFSDFECPFCERHYPTLKKILSDYDGKVRLVYKHFPLSFHPNSQKAAEASECADEQDKFWQYHDRLFENQAAGYSVDKFKQWADELGLSTKKFNDCLDTDKYVGKVAADEQEGQTKGVQGTPATFINGQLISGALPYESFKQIIDGLLN